MKVNGLAIRDDIRSPLTGKEANELVIEMLKCVAAPYFTQEFRDALDIQRWARTTLRLLEEVMTSRDLRKALKAETANGVCHSLEVAELISRLDRKEEQSPLVCTTP